MGAHTEAPLLGSMVLAGIMLKFGGYGVLLLAPSFTPVFIVFCYFALTGGVICSVLCLRRWDSKTLVAYSSIVHIGVSSLGALSCTETGYWVSLTILFGHGLVSPLLFSLCADLYSTTSSRALINNVTSSLSPLISLLGAVLLGINIGTPPFLCFWVEVNLYLVIVQSFQLSSVALFFITFLVYSYCLFLFLVSFSSSKTCVSSGRCLVIGYVPGVAFLLLLSFWSSIFLW